MHQDPFLSKNTHVEMPQTEPQAEDLMNLVDHFAERGQQGWSLVLFRL